MSDRIPFIVEPHRANQVTEHLSLLLPEECARTATFYADLSISVEIRDGRATVLLSTDNLPGEMAIQILDGRGVTHEVFSA